MDDQTTCCDEFRAVSQASRRTFLAGMMAAGAAGFVSTAFGSAFRQVAFADALADQILVVLSLRGGIDGLGLVVPHGDQAYYDLRPHIAVPRERLLAADAMFGLHPNLSVLSWLWQAGEMAAVHAVGMTQPNRSHFASMELVEEAAPGSDIRSGWVNRLVGLDQLATPLEAVQPNSSVTPTLLAGPASTMATSDLKSLQVVGINGAPADFGDRRKAALTTTWSASDPLASSVRDALRVSDTASGLAATYMPANGAVYPTAYPASDLGRALKSSAQLIKSNIGTRIVAVDYGSWDMHSDYGNLTRGRMQAMVTGLAGCLDAFMRDLGDLRSRVTVVTTSEFGRRVEENGNIGLDHGWGNVMLVLGGGVRGGKYYGTWPGLGAGNLDDGDLRVTTDYRQVFAEIVAHKFPERTVSSVFPGLVQKPLGLLM